MTYEHRPPHFSEYIPLHPSTCQLLVATDDTISGMQRLLPTVSLIALVVLANSVLYHDRVLSMETQPSGRAVVTQVDYDRWKTELSNWGRWGPDDQMGALNLITPDKRKEAATLVVDGVTVSMAADVRGRNASR